MSAIEKAAGALVLGYFPQPQQGLVKKTTNVAITYDATTPGVNTQTDTTGIVELTLCCPLTASCTGLLVCFSASSNAVAKSWLDDATTDTVGLQYRFIPQGTTRTFHFSSPVTRWDMKALGAATPVYQEVAR